MSTTRLGHYFMSETLGQGTFGKVKLARHAETNEEFAIKILDKGDIKNNDLTANVRREIAIMKALNHRNIVNLREVLSSKHKLYIVMDLVRGGELFEMIERQGEMSDSLARKYFQQLVDGVDYCHRRGIVHRDLKPENLLVDENGTLKITDFGVSSMKGLAQDLLFTQCGTPYYAAPEILMTDNGGYNGQKVDAWSCGVILFLLLSGQLPFMEEDMNKLYEDIRQVRIAWPPDLRGDARDLIAHLLTKDPNFRYDLSDVKKHPWFQVDYEQNRREFESIDVATRASAQLPGAPARARPARPAQLQDPPAQPAPAPVTSREEPSRISTDGSAPHVHGAEVALANGRSSESLDDGGGGGGGGGHARPPNGMVAAAAARWSSGALENDGSRRKEDVAARPSQFTRSEPTGIAYANGAAKRSGEVVHANGRTDHRDGNADVPPPTDPSRVLAYYEDKSLRNFVEDALHGKSQKKVEEVVKKLEDMDIDCVLDIHAVVESTGSKDNFIKWLEDKSELPTVTAMRIAKIFFY